MALSEIESTLPPGFRFYPSDEELVCHYLYKKVANEPIAHGTLVEVDLHVHEPWELPEVAKLTGSEWYFFSLRDRKYATGSRTNRATKTGYWKATGKDREVRSAATYTVVGMRKTLVFYRGRAPNGAKTGWIMHEFRLYNPHSGSREDWVICRVFQKRKGDGDGQDNAAASSPTFAFGSSHEMPDHPVTTSEYYELQLTGSSPGFAPQQDQVAAGGANTVVTNAAMAHYGGAVVIDQYRSFPQEVGGALPGFSTKGFGDEHGFNIFLDLGFEDLTNHAGVRFPQGPI